MSEPLTDHQSNQLLEQYKLYVQMADNVSKRRQDTNRFYISLMSALIPILALVINQENMGARVLSLIILMIAFMGLVISFIWKLNIRSYQQLNTGKFQVIHDMEHQLPFASYGKEWEYLKAARNTHKYVQLTKVERWIPYIFSIPYWALLIYGIVGLWG